MRLVFLVEERSMKELLEIILPKILHNDVLIRIACTELESWYFGDLTAVSMAYGKDFTSFSAKSKYRIPDKGWMLKFVL